LSLLTLHLQTPKMPRRHLPNLQQITYAIWHTRYQRPSVNIYSYLWYSDTHTYYPTDTSSSYSFYRNIYPYYPSRLHTVHLLSPFSLITNYFVFFICLQITNSTKINPWFLDAILSFGLYLRTSIVLHNHLVDSRTIWIILI